MSLTCQQVSVSQSEEEENRRGAAQLCPSYEVSLAPQLAEGQKVPAHPVPSFIPLVSQSVSQSIILTDTLTYVPLLSWESVSKQKGPNFPPPGACTLQGRDRQEA